MLCCGVLVCFDDIPMIGIKGVKVLSDVVLTTVDQVEDLFIGDDVVFTVGDPCEGEIVDLTLMVGVHFTIDSIPQGLIGLGFGFH